jgi:hypothetical protein
MVPKQKHKLINAHNDCWAWLVSVVSYDILMNVFEHIFVKR